MSGPMYFKPTPEHVAASKNSNCPMATPKDSRDCEGSACLSWNRAENKPCEDFRDRYEWVDHDGRVHVTVDKPNSCETPLPIRFISHNAIHV